MIEFLKFVWQLTYKFMACYFFTLKAAWGVRDVKLAGTVEVKLYQVNDEVPTATEPITAAKPSTEWKPQDGDNAGM